jgi:hypothetical protein
MKYRERNGFFMERSGFFRERNVFFRERSGFFSVSTLEFFRCSAGKTVRLRRRSPRGLHVR